MKSDRLQAYELPTQLTAWANMKQITQDEKLKREAVLLNHVTKTVIVNFRKEQDARLAHKCLSKRQVVFKAPRVRPLSRKSNCYPGVWVHVGHSRMFVLMHHQQGT